MEYRCYNRLSTEYNQLYKENIIAFQSAMNMMCYDQERYIDFYPSSGVEKNEHVEFLVYGQAVNGWGTCFKINEVITQEKVYQSMEYSNHMPQGVADCPLDWVNVMWSNESYSKIAGNEELEKLYSGNYRAYSSFFWNVVYKSVIQYYSYQPDSSDWARKMIWSNLYKITPDKANPSDAHQLAQMPRSAMLVKKELEEIQPRFCLVLTGESWWKPFRKHLGSEMKHIFETSDELVSLEQFGTTSIIVTRRPRSGDSGKFAQRINECLGRRNV
jgi:hypothetical protein